MMTDNSQISVMNRLDNILYFHSLVMEMINNLRQPRESDNIPNAW